MHELTEHYLLQVLVSRDTAMYLYKERTWSENRSECDSVLVHDSLHSIAIVANYTKVVNFQWVPYIWSGQGS